MRVQRGVAPPSLSTELSTDRVRIPTALMPRFPSSKGKRGDHVGQIGLPSSDQPCVGAELLVPMRQWLNHEATDCPCLQRCWFESLVSTREPAREQRLNGRRVE
jgi:hypothetical protein